MRLTLACAPVKKHFSLMKKCDVEHILVSYHFIKSVDRLFERMDGYVPKTFMLDSGAFSVWANGGTIDLQAYIAFAKQLREKLPTKCEFNVVNLDVLPGKFGVIPTQEEREQSAEQGWQNMLKIEAEGLKVIHVYHQHENLKWLEKMREKLPYIGISPANDVSMKQKLAFMDSCYKKITDDFIGHRTAGLYKDINPFIKTHGFAVTSPDQLYRYPLYSADSSSWVSAGRYGTIPLFYDDLSIKWLHYKNKNEVLKHWDYVKSLGMEKLGADDWQDRTELAIRSYQKLQEQATKLWTSRGVIWKD